MKHAHSFLRRSRTFWSTGILAAAAIIFSFAPGSLDAQVLRGTLLDAATETPVVGALVVLSPALDSGTMNASGSSADHDAARTLSTREGHFELRAPIGGHYRVRIERIGYETMITDPVELTRGEAASRVFRIRGDPVPLDDIVATAGSGTRCRLSPDAASATQRLWNEVEKALGITRWTARHGEYQYRGILYQRALDRAGRPFEPESRHELEVRILSGLPFRSLPAERLAAEGYVQDLESTPIFYGPVPATLISRPFQDTHCFHVEAPPASMDLIGLAFEPRPGREVPDIEGVFWVQQNTGALEYLEFRYTGLDLPEFVIQRIGGRMEFRRLPSGEWIASSWRITTPAIRWRQFMSSAGYIRTPVVTGYVESGAEVMSSRRQ